MAHLLFALAVSAALIGCMIYFWQTLWPLLPGWLAMILFIVLAVLIIGVPIWSLARWSDRSFKDYAKTTDGKRAMGQDNNAAYDEDD